MLDVFKTNVPTVAIKLITKTGLWLNMTTLCLFLSVLPIVSSSNQCVVARSSSFIKPVPNPTSEALGTPPLRWPLIGLGSYQFRLWKHPKAALSSPAALMERCLMVVQVHPLCKKLVLEWYNLDVMDSWCYRLLQGDLKLKASISSVQYFFVVAFEPKDVNRIVCYMMLLGGNK